ncbi:MAG: DUF3795 domain-containing protein [Actinobacteria bacterium]|nr:DUF3795 domain-containing protein [Actinomycetota bacterium]
MDHEHMTAPCGLPCFECALYRAKDDREKQSRIAEALGIPLEKAVCTGCREQKGDCIHNSMPCNVYPCAEEKGIKFCFECSEFPCDHLQPYADKAAVVPHNTKLFNLCLIRKMGLEEWAEKKAKTVIRTYFLNEWKL